MKILLLLMIVAIIVMLIIESKTKNNELSRKLGIAIGLDIVLSLQLAFIICLI